MKNSILKDESFYKKLNEENQKMKIINEQLRTENIQLKKNLEKQTSELNDISKYFIKDVEKRTSEGNLLAHSHQLMRYIIKHTKGSVVVLDKNLRYVYTNQFYFDGQKVKEENLIGRNHYDVLPNIPQKWRDIHQRCLSGEVLSANEDPYIRLDGKLDWTRWECRPWYKADGSIGGIIIYTEIITDRIEGQKALKASEEKYRIIAENTSDVITIFNCSKNKHTFVSPSSLYLTGYSAEETLKQSIEERIVPQSICIYKEFMEKTANQFKKDSKTPKHYTHEFQQYCKNGNIIWVEISIKYRYNSKNEVERVGVIRNIDDRKKTELEVLYLSFHDQLTGSYNRRFYEEELKRINVENNLPITIIMADANGLKLTNDAFGHQAGDVMLKTISRILKKGCQSDEIISRIGGDEFIILMSEAGEIEAELLIAKINTFIQEEQKTNSMLSLSMGYAVKKKTTQNMDEIFKKAEDDMYRNKLSDRHSMRSKSIDLIMSSLFEKSEREKHHSDRVSKTCELIASNMNFTEIEIKQIKLAGLVHDIGKIGVNDCVLNKVGKLDDYEYEEIKKHSEIGYRILTSVNEFLVISEYVFSHHERWDGKGYPRNLKGEEIPIQSRIIAIADAFDAMTEERTYGSVLSEDEAVIEIKKHAGKQFDTNIAKIFVEKVLKRNW